MYCPVEDLIQEPGLPAMEDYRVKLDSWEIRMYLTHGAVQLKTIQCWNILYKVRAARLSLAAIRGLSPEVWFYNLKGVCPRKNKQHHIYTLLQLQLLLIVHNLSLRTHLSLKFELKCGDPLCIFVLWKTPKFKLYRVTVRCKKKSYVYIFNTIQPYSYKCSHVIKHFYVMT